MTMDDRVNAARRAGSALGSASLNAAKWTGRQVRKGVGWGLNTIVDSLSEHPASRAVYDGIRAGGDWVGTALSYSTLGFKTMGGAALEGRNHIHGSPDLDAHHVLEDLSTHQMYRLMNSGVDEHNRVIVTVRDMEDGRTLHLTPREYDPRDGIDYQVLQVLNRSNQQVQVETPNVTLRAIYYSPVYRGVRTGVAIATGTALGLWGGVYNLITQGVLAVKNIVYDHPRGRLIGQQHTYERLPSDDPSEDRKRGVGDALSSLVDLGGVTYSHFQPHNHSFSQRHNSGFQQGENEAGDMIYHNESGTYIRWRRATTIAAGVLGAVGLSYVGSYLGLSPLPSVAIGAAVSSATSNGLWAIIRNSARGLRQRMSGQRRQRIDLAERLARARAKTDEAFGAGAQQGGEPSARANDPDVPLEIDYEWGGTGNPQNPQGPHRDNRGLDEVVRPAPGVNGNRNVPPVEPPADDDRPQDPGRRRILGRLGVVAAGAVSGATGGAYAGDRAGKWLKDKLQPLEDAYEVLKSVKRAFEPGSYKVEELQQVVDALNTKGQAQGTLTELEVKIRDTYQAIVTTYKSFNESHSALDVAKKGKDEVIRRAEIFIRKIGETGDAWKQDGALFDFLKKEGGIDDKIIEYDPIGRIMRKVLGTDDDLKAMVGKTLQEKVKSLNKLTIAYGEAMEKVYKIRDTYEDLIKHVHDNYIVADKEPEVKVGALDFMLETAHQQGAASMLARDMADEGRMEFSAYQPQIANEEAAHDRIIDIAKKEYGFDPDTSWVQTAGRWGGGALGLLIGAGLGKLVNWIRSRPKPYRGQNRPYEPVAQPQPEQLDQAQPPADQNPQS